MLKLLNSKATKNLFYVQFPDGLPPAEIYGGTWRAHYENEGAFFRTPGGNATAFKAGVQEDAMRNLTGTIKGYSDLSYGTRSFGLGSGCFYLNQSGSADVAPVGQRGTVNGGSIFMDASLQVPTASEFRPRNRTIRIWECVEG